MREGLRRILMLATAGCAVLAGLPQGPLFDPAFFWTGKAVGRAYAGADWVYYGTWALIALVALTAAAIPAFTARRIAPRMIGPLMGGLVWLAAAAALALPSLKSLAGFED